MRLVALLVFLAAAATAAPRPDFETPLAVQLADVDLGESRTAQPHSYEDSKNVLPGDSANSETSKKSHVSKTAPYAGEMEKDFRGLRNKLKGWSGQVSNDELNLAVADNDEQLAQKMSDKIHSLATDVSKDAKLAKRALASGNKLDFLGEGREEGMRRLGQAVKTDFEAIEDADNVEKRETSDAASKVKKVEGDLKQIPETVNDYDKVNPLAEALTEWAEEGAKKEAKKADQNLMEAN